MWFLVSIYMFRLNNRVCFLVFKLTLTMTHDYNTRGMKHDSNVSNDYDTLTNAKLEENIVITLTPVQAKFKEHRN